MPLTFHPFTLGIILVVAVGTVAWTLWSSNNQQQYAYGNSSNNEQHYGSSLHDSLPTTSCTTDIENKKKKKKNVSDDVCSICLGKLKGESRVLPCNHMFHSNCISMWLIHKPNCPICRNSHL